MGNKKITCDYCGQSVWEDKLTILDLSGWDMKTGNPVSIHEADARVTRILCKECLNKKVFGFMREKKPFSSDNQKETPKHIK